MGQGFSLATLSAGSAGIDVPELSDLAYQKSLGSARFMKSIRARHRYGMVVVKLVIKPYQPMDLGHYIKAIRHERDVVADVPNVLGYQRIFETGTNGYLVRQYLYSSLYDRMSTRPFLEEIEKKWLSFQLLCALRDCHSRNVFHGDIKTENILVTSWNWLYLTDFSSSFKKTYLPEDNPADFSYYFDTSGRRTCYLAPERFLGPGEKEDGKGVTWAMDVFSVGCVIAELFVEAPIFSLSQLFKYRKGNYDPELGHLSKIQDVEVRDLVIHMIQVEPESRYSADEYLNFWRRKAFPEYFYSFLHQYMGLITDPSSGRALVLPETMSFGDADDRIDRVFYDFDKISYFLGYENEHSQRCAVKNVAGDCDSIIPVQIDIPNNRHQASVVGRRPEDDGTLIFLTLVVSSLRNTARASARIRACDLMLAFAERITDEAKLDRVLPYVITLLNDPADIVKIAAIRAMTQLLAFINVVSPVNAHVFTEYIRPRLQHLALGQGPGTKAKPIVRATYASCLAILSHASLGILDMVQALRADGSIPSVDPEAEDGVATNLAYQSLFDIARHDLAEHFESHTKGLLEDRNIFVRRAFLTSVSSLCIFFGSSKANDVVLSHLNTYLNDKDWMLRCAFFETIIGVATFLGGPTLEDFILPLMVQALTDPEEFVVGKVISSFASMADLGLFQRHKTWEMVDVIARFTIHPNIWIREAAVHYISSATRYLSVADTRCIIFPLIQPYLKTSIDKFRDTDILDALKKPLSRTVFDMAVNWAVKAERGLFWKSVQPQQTFSFSSSEASISTISSKDLGPQVFSKIAKNDEDEQWVKRLRNLGLCNEDDFKLVALREYIWRMAKKKPADPTTISPPRVSSTLSLQELDVTPQTVFFETQGKQEAIQHSKRSDDIWVNRAERPHTITDALLDAATTIDEPTVFPKNLHTNTEYQKPEGHEPPQPSLATTSKSHQGSSEMPSPLSAPPGNRHSLEGVSVTRNGELRPASHLLPQILANVNNGCDDNLTSNDSMRSGKVIGTGNGIRHKSSAINLLNRNNTSKTVAETSMTSANALGMVDGVSTQDSYDAYPSTELGKQEHLGATKQSAVGHTYNGNDPNIMKLLDSLATTNHASDLAEFGPIVTPVNRRSFRKNTDSQEREQLWRPEGALIATFGEHTAAINRVRISPDHVFFITASDDGTVKVWDTSRLERNMAHRSRLTHKHSPGAKVKSITFVENTHTFVSCATDGSINVVKVDCTIVGDTAKYGKSRLVRQAQLLSGEYAVWSEHFRADARSLLLLATNTSRIIAFDLKTMSVLYSLRNPLHHGTPTCFCLDKKHSWLLLGTSHGVLDLWDLRFRLRLKAWGLAGGTPIHQLQLHPLKGKGRWVCVAGGTGQPTVTVWDIEKTQCREVYCTSSTSTNGRENLNIYDARKVDEEKPEGMLDRFATALESGENGNVDRAVVALAVGIDGTEESRDAKYAFFLMGEPDRRIRFWDLIHPQASTILSGLNLEEGQPAYGVSHPTTTLTMFTEKLPVQGSGPAAKHQSGKRSGGKPPRSTVISQQQQQLLRSHLDSILDVALLEYPNEMTISVDRAGVVYVFR